MPNAIGIVRLSVSEVAYWHPGNLLPGVHVAAAEEESVGSDDRSTSAACTWTVELDKSARTESPLKVATLR